jgi:Rps23 Pro-64 3,4-dihydroxylase Tpa1-like proline 4-hydroxylase
VYEMHIIKNLYENKLQGFIAAFNSAQPFRHIIIDNFLNTSDAIDLYENFPDVHDMRTHYKGLNEKKSELSGFNLLNSSFNQLHQNLITEATITGLEKLTGLSPLSTIEDRLGYGLHQGGNNSFLDIHIDYNIHPIQNKHRKLNLILFLNKEWQDEWGGYLEFWDRDVKQCITSVKPVFNRCVVFECSEISYHGYSTIKVPQGVTRKSYYQYYFLPNTSDTKFHDTIFKPRPQDKAIKKAGTYIKEFLKNNAKKILLRLGLKKFLE